MAKDSPKEKRSRNASAITDAMSDFLRVRCCEHHDAGRWRQTFHALAQLEEFLHGRGITKMAAVTPAVLNDYERDCLRNCEPVRHMREFVRWAKKKEGLKK